MPIPIPGPAISKRLVAKCTLASVSLGLTLGVVAALVAIDICPCSCSAMQPVR